MLAEMMPESLAAISTRSGNVPVPPGTSMIVTNQRPDSRSYRTRGSLVKLLDELEDLDDVQKVSANFDMDVEQMSGA